MKIRKSSRITAIVLALMMIVPLISVPTFAEGAATPVFTQDFESATEASDAINAAGTGNDSPKIKDVGGDHGKVYCYDLTDGPDKAFADNAESDLFLIIDNNSWAQAIKVTADKYTVNEDGTVTGYATIEGVEYKFVDAVLNTTKFNTKTLVYPFESGLDVLLVNDDLVFEEDLESVREEGVEYVIQDGIVYVVTEVLGVALETEYYLVNGRCLNAACGQTNIAIPSYVKGNDIEGTEFTLSADYYVSQDWLTTMDIRITDIDPETGEGASFNLAQISVPTGNSSNVLVKIHNNVYKQDEEGTFNDGVQVAKGTWFNLTIYANGETKDVEIYVNGKLAAKGKDASSKVFNALLLSQADRGWSLGQANRGWDAAFEYAGYYMVDNLAIYEGKVIPEETATPAYINSMAFAKNEQTTSYANFPAQGMAWDREHTNTNNTALKIVTDSYDEATGSDITNFVSYIIDQNLFQKKNAPAVSADAAGNVVVMEADYFLVPGMMVKFESQIRELSSDNGSATYVTLFYAESDGKGASITSLGKNTNSVFYNNVLPTGVWFTISNVLNLVTGELSIYVDGVLAATATLCKDDVEFKNITIASNKGYLAIKPSKIESKKKGHGTNAYKTGYTDYILVDNMETYKDLSLLKTSEYVNYDFEDRIWNIGGKALMATKNGGSTSPATATYAYAPDGDLALKLDLTPSDAGTYTQYPILGGINTRGYLLRAAALESFEPLSPADEGWADCFAKLTEVGSGMSETSTDKRIYYALVGDTAYVYQASGNAAADETGSNLEYKGAYQTAPKTENGYDLKYMECYQGGGNIDKYFTARIPKLSYNAEAGAVNTYVLSASYYVAADASGSIMSQIQNKFIDLYTVDLDDKVLRSTPGGKVTGELLVDAWNKVDMVVTFTGSDILFDVYLNGVFAHTSKASNKSDADLNNIAENNWIIAKVGKVSDAATIAALNGSVYVDDVALSKYNAEMVQTVALGDTVLTAIVDGVESKLLNTEGKFFGTTVEAGKTFDAAAYADLLYTEDVASIRTKGPTGLRFLTKIDVELLATLEVVELGTLIKPTDWDGDALVVKATKDVYYDGLTPDAEATYIAGSIVNIKNGNMDRDFVGQGYAKIKLTNGATVTIYSQNVKTISVADQAKETLNWATETGYEFTDAEIAVLEGYAAYVDTYPAN